MSSAEGAPNFLAPSDLTQRVDAALATRLGMHGGARLQRLSGGANNEVWLVVPLVQGAQPMVLRRSLTPAQTDDRLSLAAEAGVMQAAHAACVPVPQVLHVFAPEEGIGDAYLMRYVAGESLGQKIVRAPEFAAVRPQLAAQCGRTLARLHAMPVPPGLSLMQSDARGEIERWSARLAASGEARPVFAWALGWLREHCPAQSFNVCVHGDFRNGNLRIDQQGLAAVLDWELAHRGDPAEDLGWLCVNSWRFGAIDLPVGGFGRREALAQAYVEAGGSADAVQRIDFWQVMGTLKWGIMCLDMLQTWRRGIDRSIERAAIGRRASETELDLMTLLAPGRRVYG